MFSFNRRKKAAAAAQVYATTDRINAATARFNDYQAKVAAEKADLVARLSTRYYAAHALVTKDHAAGIVGNNGHLIGVCSGLSDALAEVTGINVMVVQFRLSHGIPVTENWIAVNDHPNPRGSDIRLLHDGIREPIEERLDRLHADALKATGHPLYNYYYGPKSA